MNRWFTTCALALLPLLSPAGPEPGRTELFPSVTGWSLTVSEKVYTPANLWDLIDGAADLFLSYGFVDLTLADYRDNTGTRIRVELYRHSSRENAFGMYSQERSPDYNFIDVGTQGYIEDGVLNFLCGNYYVKMTTALPGKAGREALLLIARVIEEHLKQEKTWPAVLALFPTEGKQVNSESYIAENYLGYSFLHSAFVAEYNAMAPFQIFIIELETPVHAQETVRSYLNHVNRPTTRVAAGRFLIDDKHVGTIRLLSEGQYVCGVLNCTDAATAEHYIRILESELRDRPR